MRPHATFVTLFFTPPTSSLLPPRCCNFILKHYFIKFDKNITDGPTDGPTNQQTRPLKEMRGQQQQQHWYTFDTRTGTAQARRQRNMEHGRSID